MKRTIFGLGLGTALLLATSAAQAATINVTTEIDELNADGDCSLREAIQAANTNAAVDACEAGAAGADTIVLPDNTYSLTLVAAPEDANASGDLDILETLTLQGTSKEGTIIDGNGTSRILHVINSLDLTVANVTLTNGNDPAGGSALFTGQNGTYTLTNVLVDLNASTGLGAVTATGAGPIVLDVSNSVFTHNTAPAGGTGTALFFSAGIGSLDISESSFEDNTSLAGVGGAIAATAGGNVPITLDHVSILRNEITNPGGQGGGAYITSGGNITLLNTTVEDNSATVGAGLFISGGGVGVITVDGGSISGNENPSVAAGQGGGIFLTATNAQFKNLTIDNNFNTLGGGVFSSGSLSIKNSTISNNTAGILLAPPPPTQGGGIFSSGILTLENVTLSGNEAQGSSSQGGAVFGSFGPGSTITNTTIVNNSAPSGSSIAAFGPVTFKNTIVTDSCFGAPGTITSAGHNIDQHNTCGFGTAVGDRTGTDPLLGPLFDNGTSGRKTHILLEGSPAIDNGDEAGAPATDARGVTRPLDGNGDSVATTDIGAVEIGCGDGVAQSFLGESCDDGNTDNNDACNNACTSTSCGDGVVNPGEECDNGAANSDTEADACRATCTSARCGDGVIDAGEACDDGNTANGDECTSTCEEGAGTGGGDSGGGCSLIR